MPILQEKTISRPVEVTGVALHSGASATVTLMPAPVESGIVFVRSDLEQKPRIAIKPEAVVNTQLCTQLGLAESPQATVSTIEHLMAALHVYGISNLFVDVNGPELPVLDGSSKPWLDILQAAGVEAQQAALHPLSVKDVIEVVDGAKIARVSPAEVFELTLEIDYSRPDVLAPEKATFLITAESFAEQIAAARTFCFEEDIAAMHAHGLAKGGSLENAVVMGKQGLLNPEGWRFNAGASEAIRHKALDIIGDLYMAGRPVLGKFYFKMPGHGLNNKLLRAIMTAQ